MHKKQNGRREMQTVQKDDAEGKGAIQKRTKGKIKDAEDEQGRREKEGMEGGRKEEPKERKWEVEE